MPRVADVSATVLAVLTLAALWAPPLAVCVAPSVPYASIAADYAYLTAGVDQVSATPNCDASMMVLLGDSFPLVQAAPDAFSTDNHPYIRCKTAPKTFAAAGRYGSGKVVVFGHEAMLVDVIGDPDNGRPRKAGVFEGNAVLLINALRWLLAAVPPTRRPVIVGMHPLQEDIEPGRVRAAVELLANYTPCNISMVWPSDLATQPPDLYIVDPYNQNLTTAETVLIRDYVRSGGSLFSLGQAWVWHISSKPEQDYVTDMPLNQLLAPMGFVFVGDVSTTGSNYNWGSRPAPSARLQDNAAIAELLLTSADPSAIMPGGNDPTVLSDAGFTVATTALILGPSRAKTGPVDTIVQYWNNFDAAAGLLSPSSPPYPPSPPPLPPSPQQAPVSSPSSVNATAIAVPVTVGVVAIAAIIAFFMWRHHRRSQAADQMDKIEHGSGGDAAGIKGMSEVSSGAGSSLPHVPIKASPSSPSAFGTTATNSAPTTGVSTPPHPHPSSGTAEDLPSGSQDPFVGVVLDDLPQKPVMPEAPALLPLAHAVPAATLDVNGQPPLRLDIDVKRDVALGRLIGTGSFAMVHEGVLYGTYPVAVKLHRGTSALSPQDLGTFSMEIEVLGQVQHPNIVACYGGCLTPPDAFLVQELMSCSLDDYLYKAPADEPRPMVTLLRLCRDVAAGLAYLHPSILHRDLKPSNVLLDNQGRAKISDFGLARHKVKTSLSTENVDAGLAPYMAPECFDITEAHITDKSDVYAIGTLMWEVMMQQRPWTFLHPGAIANNATLGVRLPLPPSSRCPQPVIDLIERCWQAEPDERPTAAEVLAVLDGAMTSMEVA